MGNILGSLIQRRQQQQEEDENENVVEKKRRVVVTEHVNSNDGSGSKRQKVAAEESGGKPPSLFSTLGLDIISHHVMKYLDEDALIQCELASEVFYNISHGSIGGGSNSVGTSYRGIDYWKELYKYRHDMLGSHTFEDPIPLRWVVGKQKDGEEEDEEEEEEEKMELDDESRSALLELYQWSPCWSTTNAAAESQSYLLLDSVEDEDDAPSSSDGDDDIAVDLVDNIKQQQMMNRIRFFGIISAKAREYERHGLLFHRHDDDDIISHELNNNNNSSSVGDGGGNHKDPWCHCNQFIMDKMDKRRQLYPIDSFDHRINEYYGDKIFVRLSTSKSSPLSSMYQSPPCQEQQPRLHQYCVWQGWCNYEVTRDSYLNDELHASIENEYITTGGEGRLHWPKVQEIQQMFRRIEEEEDGEEAQGGGEGEQQGEVNGGNRKRVLTSEERDMFRQLAKELAEVVSITSVNSRGQLIVSTGGFEDFVDIQDYGRKGIDIYLRSMHCYRGSNFRAGFRRGVSVYLSIGSYRFEIVSYAHTRNAR